MDGGRILVVEDDEHIQQLVGYHITRAGYQVTYADDGETALKLLEEAPPDLLVLDIMLPGLDGLSLLHRIRRHPLLSGLPVLLLTAKGEDEDVAKGLDGGADDYVTKPFSPKVLVARVKAALRRRREAAPPEEASGQATFTIHGIRIDPGRHQVTVDGSPVALTATEFAILALFASRPGWVFSRQQIIDAVRGAHYVITPRAVDVQVFGLRRKLGSRGSLIETVRGVGYRLKE